MKNIGYLFITLLISFMVASCAPTYKVNEGSYAPQQIRDPNLPGCQIRWNNVSLLDRSIKNKVFVEATNSRRTATGSLEVWAIFRNRTDYPLQLQARASLFDATQAPLEGPTMWQRVMLPPNGISNYKLMFTSRLDSGYYNIEVREGR